jgi:hypothetical protein
VFQPHPGGIFGPDDVGARQRLCRQPGLEAVAAERLQPEIAAQESVEPGLCLGDVAADEDVGRPAGRVLGRRRVVAAASSSQP